MSCPIICLCVCSVHTCLPFRKACSIIPAEHCAHPSQMHGSVPVAT